MTLKLMHNIEERLHGQNFAGRRTDRQREIDRFVIETWMDTHNDRQTDGQKTRQAQTDRQRDR